MKRIEPDSGDIAIERDVPEIYRLSTYDYQLPRELIAQEPAPERDRSRLLVLNRNTGDLQHRSFFELPSLLQPTDLLVINDTRVVPAAIVGSKPTGGRVELLMLDPAPVTGNGGCNDPATRVCLVRSSKPLRKGTKIIVGENRELDVMEEISPGRVGIRFPVPEDGLRQFLERYGRPPLPPYIRPNGRDLDRDGDRYQTVYARSAGSVAAPTAGLHFTDELLDELADKGIEIARVLLHVGPGTFTPVRTDDVRQHAMESEYYEISTAAANKISHAVQQGHRIIAVGTTVVRTVETAAASHGLLHGMTGKTDLFIIPGYSFKAIRGMVTNFHLPKSTLLMLVCALAGTERCLKAYKEAVSQGYRFYSYGDACLIID
jgi:S-adenosylmethionine:tRNA ribosyltransferase-isomerase